VRLTVREPGGKRQVYVANPDGTMTGRDGFGAAFATLHPRLAQLAEGRVDLHELHASQAWSGQFTGAVVDALQQHGIAASVLAETDSRIRRTRTEEETARMPPHRPTMSNPGTGMTID
jgi:hypothetical protein